MRFLLKLLVVLGTILTFWLGIAFLVYVVPDGKARPVKMYNVVLLSNDVRVTFNGTHITNNGFCTSIWLDTVLDTTICAPHVVTEAVDEAPAAEEAPDQHKKNKTQARL